MDSHEISRLLSYDYLVLVPALALGFNLLLLWQRRWRELLVFNIAGGINVVAEVVMMTTGARSFDTDSLVLRTLVILSLGWVTNGFLFSLGYINLRYWLGRESSRRLVVMADLIFLIGLPLASIPYGVLDGVVRTWRTMGDAVVLVEPVAAVVLAAVIFVLGYRRLLWRLLLIGSAIDLCFELRLLAVGIRPIEQLEPVSLAVRVLFEMNIALMVGFLLLKGIFRLNDYRDGALARDP